VLDVKIPSCEDFISIFGCSCDIDNDFVQSIKFEDAENNILNIKIGLIDNSVRVILLSNSNKIINDIYLESLQNFEINEETQKLKIIFNSSYKIILEINLWEVFEINISGMVS